MDADMIDAISQLLYRFPSNPVELACLWIVVLAAVVVTSTLVYDSLAEL